MKQILRITIGLVISCLIAGTIMGGAYVLTAKAKKHNEHQKEQDTMLGLLGYGSGHPAPSALKLYSIYRYVIDEKGSKYLGYVFPVKKGNDIGYSLLTIDLDGKFHAYHELTLGPEQALDAAEREKALAAAVKGPANFVYSDETVVASLDGKRLAYLLPGQFQGFKTFIKVMLALDPTYKILGLEIMENEEDPGLGGDIVQDFFKNQFKDKPYQKIKQLEVVKEPLPEDYRKALEAKKGSMSAEELNRILAKYQDSDIYALTGATISSKAVTDGVKGMVRRFAYRVEVLDRVVQSQHLPVAF
jgi:H+/Na+-translocating ferredoxin:NAD+ oxidoreductase subunit G